jgi:hypothetical protein
VQHASPLKGLSRPLQTSDFGPPLAGIFLLHAPNYRNTVGNAVKGEAISVLYSPWINLPSLRRSFFAIDSFQLHNF